MLRKRSPGPPRSRLGNTAPAAVREGSSAHERRGERMIEGVRAARLKLTPQRVAIIRELATDDSHPTAQELFDRLRPMLPMMSFATVYNTLDALATAGLCRAVSLSPGSGRFDPNMEAHHHVVCDRCGAVRDLPLDRSGSSVPPARSAHETTREAEAVAEASPGFRLRAVERIFRGVCARCATRASRSPARKVAAPQYDFGDLLTPSKHNKEKP